MDDVPRNCQRCHEITRDPDHHECGLNLVGGLPANQPHKVPEPDYPRDFAGQMHGRLAS